MHSPIRATLCLFLLLLSVAAIARAQEPFYNNGTIMLRYPLGAGFYHYLGPCIEMADESAPPADGAAKASSAICWAVTVIRIKMVDGKAEASSKFDGRLAISAAEVEITPSQPGDKDLAFRSPVSGVLLRHEAGKPLANLIQKNIDYQFIFTTICDNCTRTAVPPLEPSDPASLDAEFDLVSQSLKDFYGAQNKVARLAVLSHLPPGANPALGGVMGSLGPGPAAAHNPSGSPMRLSAGMAQSLLEEKTDPIYPPAAEADHIQGAVVLHAVISKTGAVEKLSVVNGPQLLQQSALDAVNRWKYRPFLLNGAPTAIDTTITVDFILGDSATPAPPQTPQN